MSNMPWLRLYTEFASDPVIQSLSYADQRHYICLLCLKGQGVIDRKISQPARERIIFRGLGLSEIDALGVKDRLQEQGLIDKNWQIAGWNKRQFISDHSTQRTRKYRKTKETGNGLSQSRKRIGDGPDTDTDTLRISDPTDPPEVGTSASLPAEPQKEVSNRINGDDCKAVLSYLNLQVGSSYRHTNNKGQPSTHRTQVHAILKKGYSVDDCKRVIDDRIVRWLHDDKMHGYLTPSTLFRLKNFERYLDEAPQ